MTVSNIHKAVDIVATTHEKNRILTNRNSYENNGLDTLRTLLETNGFLSATNLDINSKFEEAISNSDVRRILKWDIPEVTDLSDNLLIGNSGRVSAIRMDTLKGVGNLKKHVIAGILLRMVIRGELPKKNVDTLVDSGNMNTGFSLRYYCRLFDMRGLYIMSRYFPKKMVDLLVADDFEVIHAPENNTLGLEEEFYRYLFNLVRTREFRINKKCLWHAKYGSVVLYPLGEDIAKTLDTIPDFIVLSIGSGATLSCMVSIQDYFRKIKCKSPKIIIVEHERSPIYARRHNAIASEGICKKIEDAMCKATFNPASYKMSDDNRIPHYVIGPHYEKANPLLSKHVEKRISNVLLYTDSEWMKMSHYLESIGQGVGNSSAAHLSIATNLANKGYDVLTIIMEPMRSYYKNLI